MRITTASLVLFFSGFGIANSVHASEEAVEASHLNLAELHLGVGQIKGRPSGNIAGRIGREWLPNFYGGAYFSYLGQGHRLGLTEDELNQDSGNWFGLEVGAIWKPLPKVDDDLFVRPTLGLGIRNESRYYVNGLSPGLDTVSRQAFSFWPTVAVGHAFGQFRFGLDGMLTYTISDSRVASTGMVTSLSAGLAF